MTGLFSAWIFEIAILTVRAFKQNAAQGAGTLAGLPLPSVYAASFVYYGGLGLIPASSGAAKVGTALAWGMTVATFLNLYPNSTGLGGTTAPPASSPSSTVTPQKTGVTS